MTITNVITRPANRMKKTDRTFGVEIEFGLNRDVTDETFKAEFKKDKGQKRFIRKSR